MSLMDTADGAFMGHAYGWALSNPVRRVYYNITVTTLSVAVAFAVSTIKLVQVLAAPLGLQGGAWDVLRNLDVNTLGYTIGALFVATWLGSYAIWKVNRIEQRWSTQPTRGR